MTRFLMVAILAMVVLEAAAPALVKVAHAAVPIVVAVGVIFFLVRAAWFFTHRW